MRIGLALIQNGIEYVLDVRYIKLRLARESVSAAIDGPVPPADVLRRRMALPQCRSVFFKIRQQLRVLIEIDQPVGVPGVYQVVPRPFHRASPNIADECQLEQP